MGTATARPRRLRVTVTPTDGWIHPFDRALEEEPGVRREAFHGISQLADGSVITLLEVTGPVDRIESACADTADVVSYTVSPVEDRWLVFAWLESTPLVNRMLRIRRETDMLVTPPVEWTDGGSLRLDVLGDAERIRSAVASLSDVDVSVDPTDCEQVDGLTPDHCAVVEAAVEVGYYDSPRTTTLEDVAAAVGEPEDRTARLLREAERELFSRLAAAD